MPGPLETASALNVSMIRTWLSSTPQPFRSDRDLTGEMLGIKLVQFKASITEAIIILKKFRPFGTDR